METIAEQKSACYGQAAAALVAHAGDDLILFDIDLYSWKLVRLIDDWLVLYRTDPRVGMDQYARQCARLVSIYADRFCHFNLRGRGGSCGMESK